MTLPQSSSQQQSQHFLLKWNNHRSNMVNVFESLLQSENLVDVTLAVEGKFLKAHKIVLSACSPYFQAMFVNQTPVEKHPILIFHDMKFAHLKTLLEFMYRGEISIDEKDLSDVLKVAEALSIRGLSSFESDDEDSEKSSEHSTGNNSTNANTNSSNNQQNNSGNTSHHNNSMGHANSNHGNNNAGGPTGNHLHHHFQNFNNNHNNSSQISNQISDNQYHQLNANTSSNNNISCDSSINMNGGGGGSGHSHGHGHQSHKTKASKDRTHSSSLTKAINAVVDTKSTVTPVVKKRRGRQPKKHIPGEDQIEAVKIPGGSKLLKTQARIPDLKPVTTGRQGVRRRIPRRYAGTPSQPPLKREKISDGEHSPDVDPEADLFLSPDLSSSEPLSEMSVRGLDLFKYASIEDGVYRCIECEKLRIPKTFKNKYSFQRHAFLYHEGNMRKVFPCPVCSRELSRPDKMKNHLRSIHQGDKERQGRGNSATSPTSAETHSSVNAVTSGTNSNLTNESKSRSRSPPSRRATRRSRSKSRSRSPSRRHKHSKHKR